MIGTTLSHYRIVAELGRGGMGIVYKARDTKLDRDVAIKVLPAAALSNEDDRARFYREAKAAAALNHPHIAAIYQIDEAVPVGSPPDDVRPFIAMEYIEGGTLEDRIKQGPFKLREAVRIATQVAEALKAAHGKDIVHRDIKSANIMLTGDGQAKVLDFGLAQTAASTKLTRMGSTLGTIAYMSPEQARGEQVDGRTDLYSLGTVLYEMIAGRMPFGGDYEQAVVYSILNAEPDPLTSVRTGVPMELERITNKLLAKGASRRYQTAADLIADLASVEDPLPTSSIRPTPPVIETSPPTSKRPRWSIAAGGVALFLIGGLLAWFLQPTPTPPPVERLLLDMVGLRLINSVGISPDSRFIAVTGYDWDGNEGLFLYDVEHGSIDHIERSEGALYPWFSPSGTRLAYTSRAPGLNVMDVPSGTPREVLDNSWTSYWLDEDRILLTADVGELRAPNPVGAEWDRGPNYIYSLSSDSAFVVRGTERALDGAEWFFPGPRIPGSDIAIGNVQGAAAFGLDPRLYIVDTEEGSITETNVGGINAQPLTSDILIYQLGDDAGKIVARRIDPDTGEFRSPPVDLLESTFFARFQTEPHSGSLVFAPDHLPDRQLVSVLDLQSGELSDYEIAGADGQVSALHLSRDGRELIGTSTSGETGLSRVTTVDLDTDRTVVRAEGVSWFGLETLPGGRMLGIGYDLENGLIKPERRLVVHNMTSRRAADTLTADHRGLRFGGRIEDGFIVEIDGEVGRLDGNGVEFTAFAAGEGPHVSTDGGFVAYTNPSGVMAVYDRRTNTVTELAGLRGVEPVFSPDGRYLYYFSFGGVPPETYLEAEMVRLPVRLDDGFDVIGAPEFILYVRDPAYLRIGAGRIAVLSAGEVSLERPQRTSARVWWWRNIGGELNEVLPR